MNYVQYIIPKQLIRYKREIVESIEKNVARDDRKILNFQEDGVSVEITLTTLSADQRTVLEDQWSIETCPFQLAVKLRFEYDQKDLVEFEEVRRETRKNTVFSLILSNREIERCHHQGDWEISEFDDHGEGGQGSILPYSFITLSGDHGLNLYYEFSFQRLATETKFYSRFTPQKADDLEDIMDELLTGSASMDTNLVNLVNRAHTISAVENGGFYMNVITLFSCFESLLGQNQRQNLANNYSLFDRFQSCRHAIAHLDDHSIDYGNREYTIKKYRDMHGNQLSPPQTVSFDIDDFEETRVLLIDKIRNEIGV